MIFLVSKWPPSHIKSNSKCLKTFRDHLLSYILLQHLNDRELRKYVHSYLRHGGKMWTTESRVFRDLFIRYKIGHMDWIPDLLSNASEPWLVEELSSLQICLIGTFARVDAVFSNWLKKEMASYRSAASSYRTPSVDHIFETTCSPASIESRFRTLEYDLMYDLLSLLCRRGSFAMIKPFIEIGVDVNGGREYHNLLGLAAVAGNMDIIYMLLEAGANGSLAVETFLDQSKHLCEEDFRRLLKLLIENARHVPIECWDDPLEAVIKSSRALCSCPEVPKILLDRKIYTQKGFGDGVKKTGWHRSYMIQAIGRKNASVVDLLLQNGARADTFISESFHCFGTWVESCTWLTFAVMCGDAACADVLIRYGADVTALDGAGRSAIQLARNHALGSHPRIAELYHAYYNITMITAEEDAETLTVVERAFHLKFQGTKSIEEFLESGDEITPQPPSRLDKFILVLQNTFRKALRIFLTPTQTEELLYPIKDLHLEIREIWSLPFHETLLMRTMYVLSYAILLAYELQAFIRGHRRMPMPSRFILSALAFLALAFIWGFSSQGGFFWGFFAAGTKPKVDG